MTSASQPRSPHLSPSTAMESRPLEQLATHVERSPGWTFQFKTLWTRVGLFRDVLAIIVAGTLVLALSLVNARKTPPPEVASPKFEQLLRWPLDNLKR